MEADVNRSYLSKVEKGETYVGLEIIGKLATVLAQLSQLGEKSQQYQRTHSESRHYATVAGARTVLPGAVMRGGGCGGRSSLSCRTSTFCSAVSSV